MCQYNNVRKYTSTPRTVYKTLLRMKNGNGTFSYRAPYHVTFTYQIGKTYFSEIPFMRGEQFYPILSPDSIINVNHFHAFQNKEDAVEFARDRRRLYSKFGGYGQVDAVVIECTIPFDVFYYEGDWHKSPGENYVPSVATKCIRLEKIVEVIED